MFETAVAMAGALVVSVAFGALRGHPSVAVTDAKLKVHGWGV